MMTIDKSIVYWKTNEEWYTVDKDGHVTLTDKATPEAIESFEKYVKKFGN